MPFGQDLAARADCLLSLSRLPECRRMSAVAGHFFEDSLGMGSFQP
jgi:hypothetical protein